MTPSELSKWFTISLNEGTDLVAAVRELCAQLRAPTLIVGSGELMSPVIATLTAEGRRERELAGRWDLVSLQGHALPGGEVALAALLARDTETGPTLVGGQLRAGQVSQVVLQAATALAPSPTDERPTIAQPESLTAQPATPRPSPPSSPGPAASAGAPGPTASWGASIPLPKRPTTKSEQPELYPEDGDSVEHFAFGLCLVLESDGERLRLQQERDNRVREVALSMLKIGTPTLTDDGKRLWQLIRKN